MAKYTCFRDGDGYCVHLTGDFGRDGVFVKNGGMEAYTVARSFVLLELLYP